MIKYLALRWMARYIQDRFEYSNEVLDWLGQHQGGTMSLWCATYIAEETLEALPEDLHPAGRLLLQTIRSVIQTQQGTMADAVSVFEATRAGRWTDAIDTFSYLASATSSHDASDLSMVASMAADSYRARLGGDRNAERRRHVRVIASAIIAYPWR